MQSKNSFLNPLSINSVKKDDRDIKKICRSYSYDKKLKDWYKNNYILKNLIFYGNKRDKIEYFKRSKSVNLKLKSNFKNIKRPYYRNIYSNEFITFKNEINKIYYIKKYREDEITFTKNKIIPEIKWQNYDNDVLTSDEQKKSAIKKEIKNLGETIIRIQNNENFFKYNVSMYKLSQKYPKTKN